jgi:uncharacterized protein with HEPN domain
LKNSKIYIGNILECIARIEEYTSRGESSFFQSTQIQDSVIRNLEIIGEATKRLPESLKLMYPYVPWKNMSGLRDVLIHDYLEVDLNLVWNVVVINLPPLKLQITKISENLSKD